MSSEILEAADLHVPAELVSVERRLLHYRRGP